MSPDLSFVLALIIKMLVTAGIVVAASLIAERTGPMIGSLVATLPVSAGPAYVFLSVDHDATFIAATALASFVATIGTILFSTLYALVAQRNGMLVSLLSAQATWLSFGFAVRLFDWTLGRATLLGVIVFSAAIVLTRPLRHAPMPPPKRRWYDVPLRAGMVSTLVLVVVSVSNIFGSYVTGILAAFPVVFTSLSLILHPRVGGPPTAAVLAHSMVGMIGFELALAALHLTAVPLGSPLALTLALAICIGWNLTLFMARRRGRA
jgi:hypothetical protein